MAERESRPQVSAIIVVLNGEAYLEEAIDSICAQSLRDWELLIVDDGSTDGTVDIAKRYCVREPERFRLLAHPGGANLGIAASRNLGIASARGRYIAFLDADDTWMPDKLAEQVAVMDADPGLGLIYGRTLIWHSWKPGPAPADFFYDLGVEPDRRYEPPVLFDLLIENRVQTPTTCNALMRADIFDTVGQFDPRARGMFEDLSFFGKALAMVPVHVSGRTWAKYRQHDASCTARSSSSLGDEWARLKALDRLLDALDPATIPETVRRSLLRARRRAVFDLGSIWVRPVRKKIRGLKRRLRPNR